jgi:hypothetical protein
MAQPMMYYDIPKREKYLKEFRKILKRIAKTGDWITSTPFSVFYKISEYYLQEKVVRGLIQ